MRKLLMFVLFLFWAVPALAQVDTIWVRRYSGPGDYSDCADGIAIDSCGNVYVTGSSDDSVANPDYATVKYDREGNELWARRYNGPGNEFDQAFAVAVDGAGNVYVTGESYDSVSNRDYATIKYYPNGDTAWVRRYNGPANGWDIAWALAIDGSGNVYVTGESEGNSLYPDRDYATVKYGASGNVDWVRRYGQSDKTHDQLAMAIVVDRWGNACVTGVDSGCYGTIMYDPYGNELWVRRYRGPGSGPNWAYALALDSSGNVYVTGQSEGNGSYSDYATIKYSTTGTELWVKRYNGPEDSIDVAYAIAVDGSGNVYVTGRSVGSGTSDDYATIKYSPTGTELWARRYNGPGNTYDDAYAIAVDDSGSVYVTGASSAGGSDYDYATIKYDSSGNEIWVERYDGPAEYLDKAYAIAVDKQGSLYVTGKSVGIINSDYATIKYGQCTNIVTQLDVYDPGCGNKLILCWHPSPDTSILGYNVYGGWYLEDPFEQINENLITDTVYLDEDPELYYYYYIEQVTSTMKCRCSNIDSGYATIPIVLVPGWHPIPNIFAQMDSNLRENGFEYVWIPKLDGRGGHLKNADSLNKFIEHKKDSIEQFVERVYGFTGVRPNRVNLLGHSMGGIISRLYANSFNQSVDKLIMMATPNGGVWIANILAWFPFTEEAVKELTTSFMRRFNHDVSNVPGIRYHEIAGDHPIVDNVYMPWDPAPNDGLVNVNHVFCVPAETQTKTPKGHDDHNTIITNEDTFYEFVLPLLLPGITGSPNHDLRNGLITNLSDQSDTVDQLISSYFRTIFTGEVRQDTLIVDSCGTARFGICWFNGDINLVLYDPNGTLIDSAYAANTDSVVYAVMREGSPYNMECYVIVNPTPGTWVTEVTAATGCDTGETYYTVGAVNNSLRLSAWTDKESYYSNDPVTVSSKLSKDSLSVTGAMVSALILKPDNSAEQLDLFDDGAHYDGDANDGEYANRFTSTDLESLYLGNVQAHGLVDGHSFSREAFFGFWVYQASFIHGDVNGDGIINLGDVVYLITYQYKNGPAPIPLLAGDVNCDGMVALGDVVYLISYQYRNGPPPPC